MCYVTCLFLYMEMCILALGPTLICIKCVYAWVLLFFGVGYIGCPSELTQLDPRYEILKGISHHCGFIHDLRRESFCQ